MKVTPFEKLVKPEFRLCEFDPYVCMHVCTYTYTSAICITHACKLHVCVYWHVCLCKTLQPNWLVVSLKGTRISPGDIDVKHGEARGNLTDMFYGFENVENVFSQL